ncbi:UDP-glycosyltransferase 85A2 [Acorus gramineus]|uniref:UDP-glycosyltransferase 85A2 n=1 Tax=Acorus gramineus TaxID=55184 RepID=A0AAV9AFD6_ACOGR|nr:UDP-glycosyltransferase 85A2 [Acorus gramineus]
MDSKGRKEKPHALCIPYPAQGHVNPMLKLSKLLHFKGFHITFVNTEFNHNRLLRSRGPNSLDGTDGFSFETIPDGLPPSDQDATQNIPDLCDSISKNFVGPFRDLLCRLNNVSSDAPPVTHIVSDGITTFTLQVAEEFKIPEILLWTASACGFMGYRHYRQLIERGITPFKDISWFSNGHLDMPIDWIPGMNNIRLRHLPSFFKTTDRDDIMLNFVSDETQRAFKASAFIINTFDELESGVLDAIKSMFPHVYTIGPLSLLTLQIAGDHLDSIGSNLWKEQPGCLEWLNQKEPRSVVYVNFGSVTVMTDKQLIEFAWGLANSKQTFLWIIRPDIVMGDAAILPPEFFRETKERSMIASWCPQEKVLTHPAIGGFLNHSGWNSTLESVCGGVPMLCWPFFAEQATNSHYAYAEWGVGMEIDDDVKREEVEKLIRELMEGERGKVMKGKALEWKMKAEKAVGQQGSSYLNMEKIVKQMLHGK